MKYLGIKKDEINGIHRYGMSKDRMNGFLKIKMKQEIDVSKRFQPFKGAAEDDLIKLNISGFKLDDGMNIWRVLSPHEDPSLKTIEEGIGKIAEKKGGLFPEKFGSDVPLFGGLENGNFRIRLKLQPRYEREDYIEVQIGSHRVRMVSAERKRRCYVCKSEDHLANKCPQKTNLIPISELKPNEVMTPNEPEIKKKEDMLAIESMGVTEPESAVVEESPPSESDFYSPTDFEESFPKLNTSQVKRKISSPKCASQAQKNTSNFFKTSTNKLGIDKASTAPK